MFDSSREATPASAKVSTKKAKLRGSVGKKNESMLASLARRKSLRLALAAVGAMGLVKGVTSSTDNENSDSGARVTFIPKDVKSAEPEKTLKPSELFDKIFHDLPAQQKAQAREKVDKFKSKIAAKEDYDQAHRSVPERYKSQIARSAQAYGISKDSLAGIVSVENGGGEDVTNEDSDARGVAQFLPSTARQYGLRVTGSVDERTDPVKSITAAGKYLEQNKALFGGDEGLAVWSYHAGAGVVFRALRVYFQDVNGVDIGDYAEAIAKNDPVARESVETKARYFITKDKLNVWQLLSNESVQMNVTANLDDFSDTYPFQVVAAAELLNKTSPALIVSR